MTVEQTFMHHHLPLNFKGPGAYKALAVIGDSYAGIAWPAADHTQESQHFHAQIVLNRALEPEERRTLGCLIQDAIERELLDADVTFDEAAYSLDYVQPEPGRNLEHLNGRVINVDKVLLDDPEQPVDDELEQIIDTAPPVMKAYMKWQKENAFRVHPTFALCSVLLFIQAFIGRNVRLPRDLRCNLWMLLFAPSESGKAAVIRAAEEATKQLSDQKVFPAVLHFTNRFGSPEAMLWKFAKVSQVVWANEELVKELIGMMSAPQGSPAYNKATLLMELHDAATKPHIPGIEYSGHDKRAKDMPALEYPFLSAVGLGVTRNIGLLNAAATADGMLNRFLPFVVEGLPPIGSGLPQTALPIEVVKWAKAIHAKKFVEFFNPEASPTLGKPKVLEVYPEFYEDWQRECQYGAELAQDLPGIWGRYAEKVLQVAMLHALAGDELKVTPDSFAWAVRLVRWAVLKFATKFEDEGGGATDIFSRVRNALVALFKKDSAIALHKKRGCLPAKYIMDYCRAWRENTRERAAVVQALVDEGFFVEVKLKRGGIGYRRLTWDKDSPPDEVVH
ncbi:hypothetical protein J2Y74_003686 [Pseudomonas migulae]|uniref:YfjI family protein n=1 Tax=Pseudomonas migulae TaxID=78543 RepID=UPI00209F8794|nr:YfjI family protein [Pseudomonas migulae]MCP1519376.1 hypothetical protein [Pseudomonas migulae]